jgi:hypothetical protein
LAIRPALWVWEIAAQKLLRLTPQELAELAICHRHRRVSVRIDTGLRRAQP